MAIDLSNKGVSIDGVQIASAHFVYLFAYMVGIGSLASLRIGSALPDTCFIDFAPYGKRFRTRFIRRIALLRPTNLASLSIVVLFALVFSVISGNWVMITLRALVVLLATLAGIIVVIAVASRTDPGRSEIQIIETLSLLFLVTLNPDIGSSDSRLSIYFRAIRYSLTGVWEIGAVVVLIVMLVLFILLLVRILTAVSNAFRVRLALSPMERWYWRFLRIRSWVFLYLLATPVFISSVISIATKRWALVLSLLFGVVSFLFFLTHCENTLHEKWRCSLFESGNLRLAARAILTHIFLMLVPVLVYVVAK
jgi:hypothetical protein